MRYIGIDYGKKRVGVAVSDTNGKVAFPEAVWPNDATLLPKLTSLIKEKDAAAIVIGYSANLDGEANQIQAAIEDFMLQITLELGLPVHLEPEQFSTVEATRWQGKTAHTDASAAAIILDRFLVKQP
jgi:putative Holliday junction resolvase